MNLKPHLIRRLFCGALVLVAPIAQAAIYTVTTTNDTGPNSLRAVITTANGVAGPHTINFGNTGHFAGGGTINLVSPLPAITQSVAIAGWRSEGVTTNAIAVTGSPFVFGAGTSNSLQQLSITGSITNGQSISITGCVITNGGIQSAGVLQIISSSVIASPTVGIWSSGNATLNNVTVSRCNGGGIHNEGTMAIADSLISSNGCATYGGGIYSTNSLQITECQIIGNIATNGGGGGICNLGSLSIAQVSIRGNTANVGINLTNAGFGGGIYNSGQLKVDRSLIAENKAVGQHAGGNGGGAGGFGGGIFLAGGQVTLTNTTLSANIATGGNGGPGGVTSGGSSGPDGSSGAGPFGGIGGHYLGGVWYRPTDGGFASGGGGGEIFVDDGIEGGNGGFGGGGGGGAGALISGGTGAGGNAGTWGGAGLPGLRSPPAPAAASGGGGGGAGLGSAIFVHTGSVQLASCTIALNQTVGGTTNGHGVAAL